MSAIGTVHIEHIRAINQGFQLVRAIEGGRILHWHCHLVQDAQHPVLEGDTVAVDFQSVERVILVVFRTLNRRGRAEAEFMDDGIYADAGARRPVQYIAKVGRAVAAWAVVRKIFDIIKVGDTTSWGGRAVARGCRGQGKVGRHW